jgi:hypothetical protein
MSNVKLKVVNMQADQVEFEVLRGILNEEVANLIGVYKLGATRDVFNTILGQTMLSKRALELEGMELDEMVSDMTNGQCANVYDLMSSDQAYKLLDMTIQA